MQPDLLTRFKTGTPIRREAKRRQRAAMREREKCTLTIQHAAAEAT